MGNELAKKGEISLYEIGCSRGRSKGRPPKYSDPKVMQEAFIEYLFWCSEHRKNMSITGATLFLGFSSRTSFYNYGDKPDFMNTIKKIKLAIENHYEEKLQADKNPAGSIFALKNLGWTDIKPKEDRDRPVIPQITIINTYITTEKKDELPDEK